MKKSKIEGKRKVTQEETPEFFFRNSRYDNWNKSRDYKNFQRSDSKPGWYRTDSRRHGMKSGSQPPWSHLRSALSSFSRDR